MNNLNLILERIDADCQTQIDAINGEKEKKIAGIREEAENRISDIITRAEGAALKAYETEVTRAESSGKLSAREIVLGAKASFIEQIYSSAEDFICSLPEDKYVLILSRLLASAVMERQESVSGLIEKYGEEEYGAELKVPFDAAFSPEDTEKYGREIISKAEQYIANQDVLVPRIRPAKEPAAIRGGVVVKYGDSETNCSIAAMIESVKDKTDTKIARILFDQGDV